jgi:hypothetical protein
VNDLGPANYGLIKFAAFELYRTRDGDSNFNSHTRLCPQQVDFQVLNKEAVVDSGILSIQGP